MGAYRGKFSFDTFTHYKPVLEKKSMIDLPLRYGPYPSSFNFIKKILEKI
jgi:aldehyde dehydrogenase (NAD+)